MLDGPCNHNNKAGTVWKLVLGALEDADHELAPMVQEIMRNRTLVGVVVPSAIVCPRGGACNCSNCTKPGSSG